MPNSKLETYKNKATGDVYDYTDADAQGKLTAILDGTDIDSFGDVETALADYFPRSEQAVLGAVNLFYYTLPILKAINTVGTWSDNVYTWRNVQYTINADLSITAHKAGDMTQESYINIAKYTQSDRMPYEGKNITMNGCPSGGGSSKYRIKFEYGNGTSHQFDNGGGITFVANMPASGDQYVYCSVVSITDDITFKPMARLASNPDSTFVPPYAMTNKELTDKFSLQNATSLLTAETGVTIGNIYKAKVGNLVTYSVVISTTAEKSANSRLLAGWDNPEPLNDGILTGHLYASGTLYKVMFTISNSQAFLQTMETIPSGASLRGTFTYITKA